MWVRLGCKPIIRPRCTTTCWDWRSLLHVSSRTYRNTASSRHTGGVMSVACDGSVQFVSRTVDLAVWRALALAPVVKRLRSSNRVNGLQLIVQRLLIISACCTALAGCSPQPAVSDPGAAKKLLNDTLEAWKSGKQPDDLKLQSPPIFVGEPRWTKGAKLKEYSSPVMASTSNPASSCRCV